ncbi:MAG TPA: hypothetical protein VE359_21665, partial [Vicinamibacteria bacterium]|nr:hypothetical protein [Vicinamibacteria bacterium]
EGAADLLDPRGRLRERHRPPRQALAEASTMYGPSFVPGGWLTPPILRRPIGVLFRAAWGGGPNAAEEALLPVGEERREEVVDGLLTAQPPRPRGIQL